MKMVGLFYANAVPLLATLVLVPYTCAATSSRPGFEHVTNVTSSFESASPTTPLAAPHPTAGGHFPSHPETTTKVDIATQNTPAPREESTTPEVTIVVTGVALGVAGADEGPEEYYSSYDYPDTSPNNTGYIHKDPGVIPDPNTQDSRDNVLVNEEDDDEAEVSLPDDSLADTDLHDHDMIDSVMYIYFGSSPHAEGGAGRQVLIAGAAISLMAQCFALASAVRRLRAYRETSTLIFLSTEVTLTASNLIFMLGVQATDKHVTCKTVALALHYLYLVSSCWLFSISVHVYQRLRTDQDVRLRWCWPLVWLLPATLVLACYILNIRGYETQQYCWMSVERGMLLSFMIPMSTLILMNAAVTVLCQRLLTRYDINKQCGFDGSDVTLRRSLRSAAMLLPVFAVAWFMRVVALENGESVAVPVLAAITDAFLNWYIFLRSHVLLPTSEAPEHPPQLQYETTDAQPLISPEMSPIHVISHHPGGELLELRLDAISTIST